MSNITLEVGGQILFNVAGSYSPTALNNIELGTATDVAFDITSQANGAAEESVKADFGANRGLWYSVKAAMEFAVAPTTGTLYKIYLAPSVVTTAATGNVGYTIGTATAYAGGVAELDEALLQLLYVGALSLTADATTTVNVGMVNPRFFVPERYGSIVGVNVSGQALHSDAVESAVAFTPIIGDAV